MAEKKASIINDNEMKRSAIMNIVSSLTTMSILASFIGKDHTPAESGEYYEKERYFSSMPVIFSGVFMPVSWFNVRV